MIVRKENCYLLEDESSSWLKQEIQDEPKKEQQTDLIWEAIGMKRGWNENEMRMESR